MTSKRLLPKIALLALLAAASPTIAQDLDELEEVRDQLIDSLVALEADMQLYDRARSDEDQAISDLRRSSVELDRALGDPAASVALLQRLETQNQSARSRVNATSAESAGIRAELYARMKRIGQLMETIENAGIELVPPGPGVTGTWRVEVIGENIRGIFSLHQDGSVVRGTYRGGTGALGSVRGTLTGGVLRLEMIDSERGVIGEMTGDFDPQTGEMTGTWDGNEVGSGLPTRLDWEGQRLSLDLLLDQR